jgi:large repetitive protein
MNSDTNAATLEYDNFIGAYHSSLVRTNEGFYKVWGEDIANNGTSEHLTPAIIDSINFPNLTGTVLKAHLGSNGYQDVQGIILTTDGLFAWSKQGTVISSSITTSTTLQPITVNGNSQGLPTGVAPTDVKMIFTTYRTMALVTCSGDAYVLTQNSRMAGVGLTGTISTTNASQWHRVTTDETGNPYLTNVIAVRGNASTLFALKNDGTLWTWGDNTYLGNNTAQTGRSRATEMVLPSANSIKMIGVTNNDNDDISSYYVLNADGNLYALGGNQQKQLGDWTTTNRLSWVQPRYNSSSGPVMNDIHWISPNEHDNVFAAINVLTKDSINYNWGESSFEMLGRGSTSDFSPGTPNGISSTDRVLAVETGGHTSMLSKKCEDYFGYVGHRINGSMGDGTSTSANENTYTFATAVVYICGATTVDVAISGTPTLSSNGLYCNGTTVDLLPDPPGGTIAIVSGSATLSGTLLSFNGTGSNTVNLTYTVSVSDCSGITKTASLTLYAEYCLLPLDATTAQTDVTCFGAATGAAAVIPSGGTTPYTYAWSGSASTDSLLTNLTAGTYVCTITDNASSTLTKTFTITQPASSTVTAAIANNNGLALDCNTPNTTLTASGGTSYSWSNSASTAATIVTTAGTYTVTVTGSDGCTATASATTTLDNTTPTAAIANNNGLALDCNTPSTTLTASGGSSYLWSNGATTAATSVTTAGTFTVTVTGSNGCTATASATTTLDNTTPTAAISNNNGLGLNCTTTSTTLTASGGSSYLWSNGATTAATSVTTAGTFTVTVTGSNGCTSTASATTTLNTTSPTAAISNNNGLGLNCTTTTTTLTASGGSSYLWSNGATTAATSVTTAATYTVTVTGSNGCTATASAITTLDNTTPTAAISNNNGLALDCNTPSTTLTASGGSSYLWSNGATTAATSVTAAGTFTVTVTGSNGCTSTASATTTLDSTLPTASIANDNGLVLSCSITSTTLTASGGSSYLWSNGATTAATSVTTAGTFTVTVTGSNGCTATASATTTLDNTTPTAAISNNNGLGLNCTTTSTTLTASGGSSYLWSNGATTAATSVTTAGTFTVTVTGSNGCTSTASATTTLNTTSPTAAISNNNGLGLNCTTTSTTLTASGGSSYLWSNGETTAATSVTTAGTFTVTVTGSNGCTATASATTTLDNTTPTAAISNNNGLSLDCNTPSTTLTASGGSSYLWSNGATTAAISVTTAGTFTVTVTGSNGCTATASATTTLNTTSPTAAISNNNGLGLNCTTTSTTLTASGGSSYLWSNGATTAATSVTTAGTFTVTVTGSNGCTSTASATTTLNTTSPTAAISNNNGLGLNCTTTTTTLTASGGSSYLWSNGATTAATSVTTAATYTVTVTGSNGCTATASAITTLDNTTPTAAISNNNGLALDCNTPSTTLTASGGSSYLWSNGATTAATSVTAAGTFTVTVTGSNGCTSTASATTTLDSTLPTASIANDNGLVLSCSITSTTLTASGGSSYLWSNGATTAATSVTTAGTFTVTVTGSNGCTATASATTTLDNTTPTAAISNNNGLGLNCTTTSTTLTASGGSSYLWSNGATTAATSVTTAGTFTVTVTGSNGCTSTASATTTLNTTSPTAAISNNNGLGLNCTTTTTTLTASGGSSYLWSNGATTAATSVTTAATYTVTVTGSNGCTATASAITTLDNTTPTAAISNNNGLALDCNTPSTTLTASGGSSYLWSNGATTAATSVTAAGTFTVTVTGSNGCTSTASATTTLDSTLPTASIANDNGLVLSCSITSTTLTASGGSSYLWSNGATTAATAIGTAGTFTVTVTGSNGCTSTANATTTLDGSTPIAAIANSNGLALDCNTPTTTLTASGGSSYLWSNGDTAAVITLDTAGTFTVTVTASNGCSASAIATITLDNVAPTVSISPSNGSALNCEITSTVLMVTGGTSYSWSTGDVVDSIVVTTPNTYTVTATGSNGCTSSSTATIIYVDCVIDALADSYANINGYTGDTTASVLLNDSLNGSIVVPADVTLSGITVPTGLTLNTDGSIVIPSGTAAGTYTVVYEICEVLNPTNCDTATASLSIDAAMIEALADSYSNINGYTGDTTASVLMNDSLNHASVNLAEITLSGVTVPTGLTLNTDGTILIPSGTAAGTYTVTYEICEVLNPTNCDTATATLSVDAAMIEALADSYSNINGYTGDTTGSVLINDSLNHASVNPAEITLSGVTVPTGFTLNTDGTILIPSGTAAGTYTVTYEICEVLNPTNCDTATATLSVDAAMIEALADSYSNINGYTGDTTGSVLINDSLNHASVNPAEITLSGVAVPTGLTLNTDGTILIPSGTAAGTYTVAYEICEVLNPTNCDTATATLSIDEALIDAIADSYLNINGYTGDTTSSVLNNDSLNGSVIIPAEVTLTGITVPTGFTLNTDGTILIDPGTVAGTYTVAYEICEVLNPTNCDTATATLSVEAALIEALADSYPNINVYTGGTTGSVLTNDSLNHAQVIQSEVTLTGITVPSGLTLNTDGSISVALGTAAGTYNLTYEICEVLNPTNCDTAIATLSVEAAVIDAIADSYLNMNGFTGDTTASVLDNDSLNSAVANPAEITLTGVTVPSAFTLNPDGTISIASGTAVGTYNVSYEICEVLNPTNCDTAIASVEVVVNTAPIANADFLSTPEDSALLYNVLTNDVDTNGALVTSSITIISNPANGIASIDTLTGILSYLPNLNFNGNDTLIYEICDNGIPFPVLCDTALVVITVNAVNDAPVIDSDTIQATTPEDTPIVICIPATDVDGDSLEVTGTFAGPANGTISGLTNGSLCFTYIPNANYNGQDTLSVIVCDTNGGCDTTLVVVTVTPVNDAPVITSGNGASVANDTLTQFTYLNQGLTICFDGSDADGDAMSVTGLVQSPINGTTTGINSGDSCFTYIPNPDFIGFDTLTLTICDEGTPSLCDTITVIIEVLPYGPIATADSAVSTDGTITIDVTGNDSDPGNLGLTVTIVSGPGSGSAIVDENNIVYTPDYDYCGTDIIVYSVCNGAGLCDTATVAILVTPIDTDGDGIPDFIETLTADTDNDGVFNYLSLDSDGDGISDAEEASDFVIDPCNVVLSDCDNDGIPDYIDSVNCVVPLIKIPEGFSPNSDGTNDAFVIEGIEFYPHNTLVIFNRWGNKVYEATPYENEWKGTSSVGLVLGGTDLPDGTYFYVLQLDENAQPINGYIYLKR